MFRSTPPCINNNCFICENFLTDWLQVPIVETDYLYDKIHYKRLKRMSSELAKEFYRLVKRITPLVEYALTRTIQKNFEQIKKDVIHEDFPEELLPESIWLSISNLAYFKTFEYTDFKTDLDYICTRVEEECVCKNEDFIYEFIGHCLQHVMKYIPSLHDEHMKKKQVSYLGPPIGMPIQVLKNPIQDLEKEYNCIVFGITI